jgi:hypothetical protein
LWEKPLVADSGEELQKQAENRFGHFQHKLLPQMHVLVKISIFIILFELEFVSVFINEVNIIKGQNKS